MAKIDKKQMPKLAVMVVLALGLFGNFAYNLIKPSPAAAKMQTAEEQTDSHSGKHAKDVAVAAPTDEPAPTDTMRDPFLPGVIDDAAIAAFKTAARANASHPTSGTHSSVSPLHEAHLSSFGMAPITGLTPLSVKPLPGFSTIPTGSTAAATTAAPAVPPTWTVTGILGDGDNRLAVLRDGDSRRMIKTGDAVDSQYRLGAITRNTVVLRSGTRNFTLILGGAPKTEPATEHVALPSEPPHVAP